jgi:acetyltransferase
VSRYYLHPATATAEYAVVVSDHWQGRGLGWHLMQRLIDVARQRGVQRLTGLVLRENAAMLKMVAELGFTSRPTDDATVVEVVLDLGPA